MRGERLSSESGADGFSVIEFLVIVALTLILSVTLWAALDTDQDTMKAAVCLANMHQWGLAISMYCEDWNDYIPPEGAGTPASGSPWAWYNVVPQYVNTPSLITLYAQGKPPTPTTRSIYSCPSATNAPANPTDANPYYMYGMNNRMDPNGSDLYKRRDAVLPSQTFLFCENDGSFSNTNGKYCPARHGGGSNFAFVDGHAEWITYDDFCRECPAHFFLESNSTGTGDWKPGIKYHWFPFKNTPI